jgi:drug/metabolite transporter (DMT)-like permease
MRPINTNSSFFTFAVFAMVVILWALNWVVLKMALDYVTPYWLTVGRFFVGALFVLLIHFVQGNFHIPRRCDIPQIFSVGFLAMGFYFCMVVEALRFVAPGHASIIAYTTPLFLAPLAVLLYGEHFNRWKLIGLLLGVAGVVILFDPVHLDWHNRNILIGNSALLLAALSSALSILYIRYGKWHSTCGNLFFWQLLVGLGTSLVFAIHFEPFPHVTHWDGRFLLEFIYMTFIALVLCYWAMIWITRKLPTLTTSLGTLAVPVFGLMFSSLMLSEPITAALLTALGLILSGLVLVITNNK